jgi:hypothetical protein
MSTILVLQLVQPSAFVGMDNGGMTQNPDVQILTLNGYNAAAGTIVTTAYASLDE